MSSFSTRLSTSAGLPQVAQWEKFSLQFSPPRFHLWLGLRPCWKVWVIRIGRVVATDKAKLHLLHFCTGQNSPLPINTSIGVLVDSPYWICLVRILKNPRFDASLQVVLHIHEVFKEAQASIKWVNNELRGYNMVLLTIFGQTFINVRGLMFPCWLRGWIIRPGRVYCSHTQTSTPN